MMKRKSLIKKGFTLLELMIVMVIMVVLAGSMAAGLIALQNITKLDNSVRTIKTEIQAAQNQARNSFITYDRTTSSGSQEDLFNQTASARTFLNLGWIVSFTNTPSGSTSILTVTRQAVFFKPQRIYDISRLREDIVNIYKNTLIQNPFKPFSCVNGSLTQQGAQVSFRSVNTNDTKNYPIQCATNTSGYLGSDYFQSDYPDVIITSDASDLGTNGLPSCWQNGSQSSIFFTAGYGEPALRFTGSAPANCQVVFRTPGFASANKAIKVYKDNGTIELCSNYCT